MKTIATYFPSEFSIDFFDHREFVDFLENEKWFLTATTIDQWVKDVLASGLQEPVTLQSFKASEVTNETDNFREGLVAGSLNSRQRAMIQAMKSLNNSKGGLTQCDVYGLEQVTAFAERMRTLCSSFIGSEFLPDQEARDANPGIRHEDLMNLSFHENSFDVVFSNDVLEHVPDVDRALSEVYRVLRPSGVFISTFPFSYGQYESEIKASLVGGEVVFHTEPEYHGNPVNPNGSLVFEVPGWDLLDRAREIGYSRSFVRATASKRYGIIGTEVPAVFINVFEK